MMRCIFNNKVDSIFKSDIFVLSLCYFRIFLKSETNGILYVYQINKKNNVSELIDMHIILSNAILKQDYEMKTENNVQIMFKHKEAQPQLLMFNIEETVNPIITKELLIKMNFVKQVSFRTNKIFVIKNCPGIIVKLIITNNTKNTIFIKSNFQETLMQFNDNTLITDLNIFVFPKIILESKNKCNCFVTIIFN